MDNLRGNYGSLAENEGYDPADDETQAPPLAIGQDERRMQVRAYNHWASLLEDRNFPAIEDLEPDNLPDFGPFSVLLDFSSGIDNPGISYLGDKLAEECGAGDEDLRTLADVPARSLLTRITDHYMQILANQAPIGFEAEFVNQRGATIAYRGILLPFSSDDDTIDFIYGVINWKELADAQASDELLLEVDQVLEPKPVLVPGRDDEAPLTDWADGPGTELSAVPANDIEADFGAAEEPPLEDILPAGLPDADGGDLPVPSFGLTDYDDEGEDPDDDAPAFELADEDDAGEPKGPAFGSLLKMPINLSESAEKAPLDLGPAPEDDEAFVSGSDEEFEEGFDEALESGNEEPFEPAAFVAKAPLDLGPAPEDDDALELAEFAEATEIALPELDPSEMGLGDWLAAAREMAAAARGNEERTREALYEAIGRAYDFSLAAAQAPEEFDEILADSGLTMQDRAPMTPVVKLVFGADYDKTRLTEYAAALTHAHRLELAQGTLGEFLGNAEGGLKGVVKAERRLRKQEAGQVVEPIDAPRHAIARKLRSLPPQDFESIAPEGSEFALVMIRRTDEGAVVMLGEVPEDVSLVERAARRLIG